MKAINLLFFPFITIVIAQVAVLMIIFYEGRIIVKPRTYIEKPQSFCPKATLIHKFRLSYNANKKMTYEKVGHDSIYYSASNFLSESFWLEPYIINLIRSDETWLEIGANVPYKYIDSVLAVQAYIENRYSDHKVFFLAKQKNPPFIGEPFFFFKSVDGIKTIIKNPDSLSIRWKNIQAEQDSIRFKLNPLPAPPAPPGPKTTSNNPTKTYKVTINQDSITLNGAFYDLKIWKKFWCDYLKTSNTDSKPLVLQIYTAPDIPYQYWLEVLSSIQMVQYRLEEVAISMLGEKYAWMPSEQQDLVRALVSNTIPTVDIYFYLLE